MTTAQLNPREAFADALSPSPPAASAPAVQSSESLAGLVALGHRFASAPDRNVGGLHGFISAAALRTLLSALHLRDAATYRHCRRVAMIASGMARFVGWNDMDQKRLEIAALLHDVGKLSVPDNVLHKPSGLNAEEVELFALLHDIAVDVLLACRVDYSVVEAIKHAYLQTSGQLDLSSPAARQCGQASRVLAVADAYDSLRTDKAYRGAKSHEEIVGMLSGSGRAHFDGSTVTTLSRWAEAEGLPQEGNWAEAASSRDPFAAQVGPEDALEANSIRQIFSVLYTLEHLYDGFYLVDADMRFVLWNNGLERALGRTAGEMLGQVWTSRSLGYCHANGGPITDFDAPLRRAFEQKRADVSALHLRREGGPPMPWEVQTIPLGDGTGQVLGAAEIFRNPRREQGGRTPERREPKRAAASRDSLTSVANRGEIETQLAEMVSEASRGNKAQACVVLLDVDHFKSINDGFGPAVGDQVLIDVARIVQNETYCGEIIGRYGGEAFVILCPDTDLDQATRRAERLRTALARSNIGGLSDYKITASFGVTQVEQGDTVENVLKRADRALHNAKESGRNRTCSVTRGGMYGQKEAGGKRRDRPAGPLVYSNSFHACVAADMVVYKLGGFVADENARLVKTGPKKAVLRIGNRGLIPFWGGTPDRQPVEVNIEFHEDVKQAVTRSRSRQVEVKCQVRPLGFVRDPQVFDHRARHVVKLLRSYFVAGGPREEED